MIVVILGQEPHPSTKFVHVSFSESGGRTDGQMDRQTNK